MMSSPSSGSQPNAYPLCLHPQSNLRSAFPAIFVRLISEKLGRPSTSSSPSRYLSWDQGWAGLGVVDKARVRAGVKIGLDLGSGSRPGLELGLGL
jgi:hypothetical protein